LILALAKGERAVLITAVRKVLILIAAGVMIGVVVAGFLAYFTVTSRSGYSVDGLGRPLGPSPWFARWLFGADKEWAGLGWFLIDLLWF
jgi:hypothetical protein